MASKKGASSGWALRRAVVVVALLAAAGTPAWAANWTLVGWNNLGMHCMDSDFSVLSLLPPYNTIHAQLIDPQGNFVTDPTAAGITVTYEAIADPDGSINTTSQNHKTNFWQYVQKLFGAAPAADVGIGPKGAAMPGPLNQPQPMTWESKFQWFVAEGIPITPYDDNHLKNPYPLMRLVARDSAHAELTHLDIVLPVSDEMDCKVCHLSNSGPAAKPVPDWVHNADPDLDVRLNILLLHDNKQGTNLYPAALSGSPALCAGCHASEALGTGGLPGVPPLTQSIHGLHANVVDPLTHLTLDSSSNRTACYRCHPGSATRCLRGAMGAAVAPDGSMEMQCQSCHGSMSAVAAPTRTGWLDEPACQSCHTGTATHNNGQIRYTSVFDSSGQPRQAVDQTFATNPNTPGLNRSLYRFSIDHGGLQCSACHGSTHAEFPSSHRNDNIQSIQHQGHVGMFVECVNCHGTQPVTVNGGPHGMHPVGQAWVDAHDHAAEGNTAQCQACHGTDYRGTVLSRSKADRLLSTDFGGKFFWRGFQIGCYTCHSGPSNESANPNRPAVVSDAAASTSVNTPVTISLLATDPDGNTLTLRIVSQPTHGTTGLNGTVATYFPDAGFTGNDTFTFAAWDGSTDSNLGTVTLTVGASGPAATATPTPAGPTAPTPTPTMTQALATRTPTQPRTPTPTRSTAPTRTPTQARTATPTRTITPTRTPTPTPTATRAAKRRRSTAASSTWSSSIGRWLRFSDS